jgi:hypothetical protein
MAIGYRDTLVIATKEYRFIGQTMIPIEEYEARLPRPGEIILAVAVFLFSIQRPPVRISYNNLNL